MLDTEIVFRLRMLHLVFLKSSGCDVSKCRPNHVCSSAGENPTRGLPPAAGDHLRNLSRYLKALASRKHCDSLSSLGIYFLRVAQAAMQAAVCVGSVGANCSDDLERQELCGVLREASVTQLSKEVRRAKAAQIEQDKWEETLRLLKLKKADQKENVKQDAFEDATLDSEIDLAASKRSEACDNLEDCFAATDQFIRWFFIEDSLIQEVAWFNI